MQQLVSGYRGLTVLMNVNVDRIIYVVTIVAALAAGAFVGAL